MEAMSLSATIRVAYHLWAEVVEGTAAAEPHQDLLEEEGASGVPDAEIGR